MRVLFAGGGTAGHINPALAIAGYLREKEPDTAIVYVGNKGGMEERLVPAAGFEFRTVHISGFQRKLTLKNIQRNLQTLGRIVTSSQEAKKIIRDFKPDICVGTGGYVSGPVIREAMKLGIPAVIHEQNAYPGVTNKMLAKKASRVMLAVADAQRHFEADARCILTGNPVRQELARADKEDSRRQLVRSARTGKYQHIHGYGQYAKWMPQLIAEKGLDLKEHPCIQLREYINNMPECMAAADLVICRAGAITLSELQAQGKASILIPSPNVAENHQYHNAMALVRRNAAVLIEEKDLTGELLWNRVEEIFARPGGAAELGENAAKMAIPDACERIVKVMHEVLKESRKA